MKKDLEEIQKIIGKLELNSKTQIKDLLNYFLQTHLNRNKVDNFIGDYPTFIEPVHLEDNVRIGDDVLLGPNVYIGKDSEIKDYVEISNSIIFDNVFIGKNNKLGNCIIGKNTSLVCENINVNNCVIVGNIKSKEDLYKIIYKFE